MDGIVPYLAFAHLFIKVHRSGNSGRISFGLRVKLPVVITNLTTQRQRQSVKYLA